MTDPTLTVEAADFHITSPGVYPLPANVYHGHKWALSSGRAKSLVDPESCPAKVRHADENPEVRTKDMDFGKAAHEWLLEGDSWPQRFTVLSEGHNGTTKAGKAEVAEIEAAGKIPLKHEAFETIKAMVDALKAHSFAWKAFRNGRIEQSLYWKDAETGIWCRCRPDYLPIRGNILVDYKTQRSAAPIYLRRSMYNLGYHQQADWYCTGVRELGLIESPRFVFIMQEKTPPYLVKAVESNPNALAWAAIQNRAARHIFARCLRSGEWPDFGDDVEQIDLPPWAEKQLQDQSDSGLFEIAAEFQAPLSEDAA